MTTPTATSKRPPFAQKWFNSSMTKIKVALPQEYITVQIDRTGTPSGENRVFIRIGSFQQAFSIAEAEEVVQALQDHILLAKDGK